MALNATADGSCSWQELKEPGLSYRATGLGFECGSRENLGCRTLWIRIWDLGPHDALSYGLSKLAWGIWGLMTAHLVVSISGSGYALAPVGFHVQPKAR